MQYSKAKYTIIFLGFGLIFDSTSALSNVKPTNGGDNNYKLTTTELNYVNNFKMNPQQTDELIRYFETPQGYTLLQERMRHPLLGATAVNIMSPVAYGPSAGVISSNIGFINHWPGGTDSDGFAQISVGLGDADRYVGLQITPLIDSLGFRDDGFAQNGTVDIKVFRWLGENTAVAVGAANATGWGTFKDFNESYYGAVTHIFNLLPSNSAHPLPLVTTAGLGTGAFNSPFIFQQEQHNNDIEGFASIALQVHPRLSLIVDYTSQILSSGISFIPTYYFPLVITAYATNLAGGNMVSGGVDFGVNAAIGWKFF